MRVLVLKDKADEDRIQRGLELLKKDIFERIGNLDRELGNVERLLDEGFEDDNPTPEQEIEKAFGSSDGNETLRNVSPPAPELREKPDPKNMVVPAKSPQQKLKEIAETHIESIVVEPVKLLTSFSVNGWTPSIVGRSRIVITKKGWQVKREGYGASTIYIDGREVERLKKMTVHEMMKATGGLGNNYKSIVRGLIEDLKDADIGALPMLNTQTRPGPEEKIGDDLK